MFSGLMSRIVGSHFKQRLVSHIDELGPDAVSARVSFGTRQTQPTMLLIVGRRTPRTTPRGQVSAVGTTFPGANLSVFIYL
jgi:hypothetical protein